MVVIFALGLASRAFAYDVQEKSLDVILDDLANGRTTAVELVSLYEARISSLNPILNAVIAVNPNALKDAQASDAQRRAGAALGPLAGAPILIKDNIETADPVATTAGSLALAGNVTGRDAYLVSRLRSAGAIILGKANLSEWANIRSNRSISGWSAVGGQVRNPYALDRTPCGSSAGSGAAAAASLAAAALGTETDGSITCPSAMNGLVGLKPTVGLVSRTRVVPISHSQDTAGPMTRSVRDAARLLTALAGSDPADPATRDADLHKQDYLAALDPLSLSGARIGVLRYAAGFNPDVDRVFERALQVLRTAGARLVDIETFPNTTAIGKLEHVILLTELKVDLNRYLETTSPAQAPSRTLADLIAFDQARAAQEMPLFGQEGFIEAQATGGADDPVYLRARSEAREAAGAQGIDRMLQENGVVALIAPTTGPAWLIDPVLRDRSVGGGAGQAAAVAGYPHLTVPMGAVDGLPVGLSFIGPAWSEASLLSFGYAFEQASHARAPPTFPASVVFEPPSAVPATRPPAAGLSATRTP